MPSQCTCTNRPSMGAPEPGCPAAGRSSRTTRRRDQGRVHDARQHRRHTVQAQGADAEPVPAAGDPERRLARPTVTPLQRHAWIRRLFCRTAPALLAFRLGAAGGDSAASGAGRESVDQLVSREADGIKPRARSARPGGRGSAAALPRRLAPGDWASRDREFLGVNESQRGSARVSPGPAPLRCRASEPLAMSKTLCLKKTGPRLYRRPLLVRRTVNWSTDSRIDLSGLHPTRSPGPARAGRPPATGSARYLLNSAGAPPARRRPAVRVAGARPFE